MIAETHRCVLAGSTCDNQRRCTSSADTFSVAISDVEIRWSRDAVRSERPRQLGIRVNDRCALVHVFALLREAFEHRELALARSTMR